MADEVQALANLTLSTSTTAEEFVNSPRGSGPRLSQRTLPTARRVSLFSDLHTVSKQLEAAQNPNAPQAASWSAVLGDVFQAVVERLPAHTAQHAMLVCRQWHDSVTNGLVHLRPRALRLNCIRSRSVLHTYIFQHALHGLTFQRTTAHAAHAAAVMLPLSCC